MKPINDARVRDAMKAYAEANVEEFRKAIDYVDIPLQTYALFLFLPLKGEVSMSQVVKLFNTLSQAAVSRNVDVLCGTSKIRTGGGYPLADRYEDKLDRRNKMVCLSTQGRALRESMHLKGMQIFNRIMGEDHA